jgi:rod shape-determining protein MreD
MANFFLQGIFFYFVAIVQFSWCNVVAPSFLLNLLLAVTIAWTLIRGFSASMGWVLFLGFLFDGLSLTPFGITSASLLLFSYVTNFVAKRLTLEHKGQEFFFACICMIVLAPLYELVTRFFFLFLTHTSLITVWQGNSFSLGLLLQQSIVRSMLMLGVFWLSVRIGRSLSFSDSRVLVVR